MVDITPAGQRPYVGSSTNNTELDLVFGYDGLDRVFGGSTVATALAGPIGNGAGSAGPLRLLNRELGGQIGWLLPLALIGLIVTAAEIGRPSPPERGRRRQRTAPFRLSLRDPQAQGLLFWGTWLISLGLLYSVSSYFHPYNTIMLAPAICALAAIGLGTLWRIFQRGRDGQWLLPATLVLTAAIQTVVFMESPDWNRWLLAPMLLGALGAAASLTLLRGQGSRGLSTTLSGGLAVVVVGAAALLVAPAAWSAVPVWHYGSVGVPTCRPRPARSLP